MVELPFDQCVLTRHKIMLAAGMKDRLEPEEWRPIIASVLFFSKRLRIRLAATFLAVAVSFVLLGALLFFILPVFLPESYTSISKYGVATTIPLGYFISTFLAPILALIGTVFLGITSSRRIRLLADRRAAELVSATFFLEVLGKVARAIELELSDRKRRFGGRFSSLPSVESRIAHLQKFSGNGT